MEDPAHASTTKLGTIGRYRILEALESGGMGTVYRAFDPRLQTHVCIKQIKDGPGSAELYKRWLPEVRAIGQLRHHPNIVNIYDASEAEYGGRPTIVMEFIEGRTLQRIIKDGDALRLGARLHYMEQLAAGLGHAHSKNIVHRDIKPANVMIDKAGVLKILDFGIARMSAGTTGSAVVGTMNYMSPEQWGQGVIDLRSDIFSAGAVFYEILCGHRAFPGDTVMEVYPLILSGRPRPLEDFCPGLGASAVRLVNRMLEKRVADRYQSLEPVQRELEQIRAALTPAAEENFDRTLRWERHAVEAVSTPRPASPGRPVIDRESVIRRRAAKIEAAVGAAQQAFASSSYDDVLAACEQVLELDPDHAVALDLLERARSAVQQREARQLTADAREQFARGDFSQAIQFIEAALALSPGDVGMLALREQIAHAKADLAGGRAKLAAIQKAMALVHSTIDAGELEEARHHIDVVLGLDPANAEALRLRSLVHRLVDERDSRNERKPSPAATQDTKVVRARLATNAASAAILRFWRPVVGAMTAAAAIGVGAQFVINRPVRVEPKPPAPVDAPSTPAVAAPDVPKATSAPADNASEPTRSGAGPIGGTPAGKGGVTLPTRTPVDKPPATESSARPAARAQSDTGRAQSASPDREPRDLTVSQRLQADRYLRQAQDNLDVGDWSVAAANADKARALDPANPGLPKMLQDIEIMKRLEERRRKSSQLP